MPVEEIGWDSPGGMSDVCWVTWERTPLAVDSSEPSGTLVERQYRDQKADGQEPV